jgi:uncharacterized membrane protein
MKKLIYWLVILASVLLFAVDLNPPLDANSKYEETIEGTVLSIESTSPDAQTVELEISKGSNVGEKISVNYKLDQTINALALSEGDRIVLIHSQYEDTNFYEIVDFVRRPVLYALFALFVLAVAVISRKQGLMSLLGMAFSFLVLFRLVLPLILAGHNPVWAAIAGCALIIPATFYLSHGVNHKTTIAILGTLVTLVFTGLLAGLFAELAHLSGLADDAATFLKSDTGDRIDFKGLLLAGVLISMLGVLDDISVSQASVAEELRSAKKGISFFELYGRTMTVGKDHIAAMVNTLVLVYAGASIPLLLLFIDHAHSFSEVLNYEFVANEIIHTLVASIGLILTVPVTTTFACFLHKNRKQ